MRLSSTMTKFQLFALLTSDGGKRVTLPDGNQGTLDSIQREDGSGRCFNLTVCMGYVLAGINRVPRYRTMFVRTSD